MNVAKGSLSTIQKKQEAIGEYISESEKTNVHCTSVECPLPSWCCGDNTAIFGSITVFFQFSGRILDKRECRGCRRGYCFCQCTKEDMLLALF
jgi:hypothetical protein